MIASLAFKAYGHKEAEPAIAAGSAIVFIALLIFAANVLRNGGLDASQRSARQAGMRS